MGATLPTPALPTFGGVDGGFEVYIQEGLAHADMTAAENTRETTRDQQLSALLARNVP